MAPSFPPAGRLAVHIISGAAKGLTAAFIAACAREVSESGARAVNSPLGAHVAIAPALRRVLTESEWGEPSLGTLIFHPSLLPLHRGPDAVRWSVLGGEAFTGITWFWCAPGLDEGPICEQELVGLPRDLTPAQVYQELLVPAGLRTLRRVLQQLQAGYVRRVAQDPRAATYESWHPSREPEAARV